MSQNANVTRLADDTDKPTYNPRVGRHWSRQACKNHGTVNHNCIIAALTALSAVSIAAVIVPQNFYIATPLCFLPAAIARRSTCQFCPPPPPPGNICRINQHRSHQSTGTSLLLTLEAAADLRGLCRPQRLLLTSEAASNLGGHCQPWRRLQTSEASADLGGRC